MGFHSLSEKSIAVLCVDWRHDRALSVPAQALVPHTQLHRFLGGAILEFDRLVHPAVSAKHARCCVSVMVGVLPAECRLCCGTGVDASLCQQDYAVEPYVRYCRGWVVVVPFVLAWLLECKTPEKVAAA